MVVGRTLVLAGLVAALDTRRDSQVLVKGAADEGSHAVDEVNMRDEPGTTSTTTRYWDRGPQAYGGSEALRNTLHIEPTNAARAACITRVSNGRSPVTGTDAAGKDKGCYEGATDAATCETLYETKQRDPSVPTDPDITTGASYPKHDTHQAPNNVEGGFDLLGEIALCRWSEVKGCLAGEFHICPDDDIVVIDHVGQRTGNAAPGGAGPQPAPRTGPGPGSETWHYSVYTQQAQGMTQQEGDWHDDRALNAPESGRHAGGDALVQKSMGTCQKDTADCPDGSTVSRDPMMSCRFTHCASGQSLLQTSSSPTSPTFAWQGVYTRETTNFCQRMSSELGDFTDHRVSSCDPDNGCTSCDNADVCNQKYIHNIGGEAGDLTACSYEGATCVEGERHTCTWTYYMEDLIRKHNTSYRDNCAGKVLESKRSLDGLLHSVEDLYQLIQAENAIISEQNVTIRLKVNEQRALWNTYVEHQNDCQGLYETAHLRINKIRKMMAELRSIASPDVRSAVNTVMNEGFQEHHLGTSMSCHAAYPYVITTGFSASSNPQSQCCKKMTTDFIASDCVARICKDIDNVPIPCKAWGDQRYADVTNTDLLPPTDSPPGAVDIRHLINNDDKGASLLEMNSAACQAFSSFVERVHGSGHRLLATPPNCHDNRTALQEAFNLAYNALGAEYDNRTEDAEQRRTICLNDATYDYKSDVEGVDGIDDHIQRAAQLIHSAQGEIARLEPKLHDVDRAVARMRNYIATLRESCEAGDIVDGDLKKIADLIFALDECPGRNDFIINVPHWTPPNVTALPTPVPTPWYERLTAAEQAQL